MALAPQLRKELEEVQQLYRMRELETSLERALTLEGSVRQLPSREDLFGEVQLLLSQIMGTKGFYTGKSEFLLKATQNLLKAKEIFNGHPSKNLQAQTCLAEGNILFYQSQFLDALQFYLKALRLYEEKGELVNECKSLCIISEWYLQQNDAKSGMEYAKRAFEHIKDLNDISAKAVVYNQVGQAYIKSREFDKALIFLQKALDKSILAGEKETEINALNGIAISYGYEANQKEAMQFLFEALEQSKKIGYRTGTIKCILNLATVYGHFNHESALNMYRKALIEYEDVLKTSHKAIIFNNIGNIYYNKSQLELAQSNFNKALEAATQIDYFDIIAQTYAQKSRTYTKSRKLDRAMEYANKALAIGKKLHKNYAEQLNLINLGQIHFLQQEYDKAYEFAIKGLEIAHQEKDDVAIIDSYLLLSEINRAQGNFEKALDFHSLYHSHAHEYSRNQRSKQVIDLEIQYAIQDKQKEIEHLTKVNEYQSILLKQAEAIEERNAALRMANEELRQFAYVASHDLKEPLRMIGSYTQLIKKQLDGKLEGETLVFFEYINEGVGRMSNLLNDLLQYATIGKEERESEAVDLNDIVDIVISHLQLYIKENNATVTRTQLPVVRSNQTLMIQLFQNLVSNAIKFKADRPPEVNISGISTNEGYTISVSDNGIGIDPEYRDRVFVIFQRLHPRTRYKGTGIGLAICQKIINRLGGRIWFESEEGEGTTFHIHIPGSILVED